MNRNLINMMQNDEGIIARIETTGIGGHYIHNITKGRFYNGSDMEKIEDTLDHHEQNIGTSSMKYITQLNSCGINKTIFEHLN